MDTEILVTDQASGEYVRTIERTVNSLDVNMQGIVGFRGGIQNWLTLYAQHLGDDAITLPDSSTSDYVLTRRPMPSDLEGLVNSETDTTQNTSPEDMIDRTFYLDEKILEELQLNGTVRVRVTVAVKTSDVSGTAYIDNVTMKLRKVNSTPTYTDLGTKTVTVNISNATTDYVEKSVVATFDLSGKVLETSQKLCLEIITQGHISNSSYICTHRLSYDAGTSKTFCEIAVEEA